MKGHWVLQFFRLFGPRLKVWLLKDFKGKGLFFLSSCSWIFLERINEQDLGFANHIMEWEIMGNPPLPFVDPEKQWNAGALWVIDAPCSTIESIQEYTIGPIDRNLATPSLQFSGFGEFQGISLLFPQFVIQRDDCWEQNRAEKHNSCPTAWHLTWKETSWKLK